MSTNTRWLFHLRALPRAAIAIAACAGASAALAQDAANGRVLYRKGVPFGSGVMVSCDDCHGPGFQIRVTYPSAQTAAGIRNGINRNAGPGMANFGFLTMAELADIAAYVVADPTPPPPPPFSPPPAGTAATPMASPNPAMLPSTPVGSLSAVVNVQFTNTSTANVTFNTPAIASISGDAADFPVAAPTVGTAQCISGRVMAPGTSCWFGVQFKPSAAGTRNATWTMNFTSGVAPRTVTLQGTATTTAAPAPSPAPAPSANAPTSGGGGALDWLALTGLGLLAGVAARRRARR